jgi:outer membrane receptor protein involved in Fe transport
MSKNSLCAAIRRALQVSGMAGAALGAASVAVTAHAQQTNPQGNQPQTLQTIVVTGSHIRRVDLETSNPVTVVSSQQIQASGALTLGDLVQSLPSMAGSATNPSVNNGGGTGASTVSLRGLGASRTLVLIDGHRVPSNIALGAPDIAPDINAIPAELVERIEILKDGASSVYGSDAIGGVVNFILKHNYQGAEFSGNYGISDRDDAERKGYSFMFGQTSHKASIIAGIDYNKFEGVSAGDRDYSKCAASLNGGKVLGVPCTIGDGNGGSLASLSGYLYDFGNPAVPNSKQYFTQCGGGALTTTTTGFRCFDSGTDLYNYQATNLVNTPQERTNAYFLATYNLSDNVQAYLDVFINRTLSNSEVAPTPMELYGSLTVEAGQPYNPFPFAVGGGGNPSGNPNDLQPGADFLLRLGSVGNRINSFSSETDLVIAGLKGNIGDTGWQWDANVNYGHLSTGSQAIHYMYFAALQASGDLDADCATNSADGCLDIFHVNTNPAAAATMKKYMATPFFNSLSLQRGATANVNGPLFSLPAGEVQLAIGADYFKQYANIMVDPVSVADPVTGSCGMASSACGSPLNGGFNFKEAYAELFIPVLKDLPFFHALNVTLGDRYSKYSLAGSTNNYKIGVEWRPVQDLMLRGTVAKVFRAPNISNLFAGVATSFDSYTNPCSAADAQPGSPHYVYCQGGGDAVNGTQIQAVRSGAFTAGTTLSPEYGKSFDFGAVYSPHFVPGLTLSADLWRVYLRNQIIQPFGQTEANICYAANNLNNPACASLKKTGGGLIISIGAPVGNLGNLWARGLDLEADYRVPQIAWLPGRFSVTAQATYMAQFDNDPTPGLAGDVVQHVAGQYNKQYGMFPRWRALVGVNWQDGPWQIDYQLRYIGPFQVGSADPSQANSCDKNKKFVDIVCHYGTWIQSNVSAAYTIQPINTTVRVGVDNVFDKQPPMMYQNNTINANTDVNTFDTIGRFYWVNATVKF